MGITSAIFQEIGKMSDSNVAFMIDVDGDKMEGKQSLITRIGILSVQSNQSINKLYLPSNLQCSTQVLISSSQLH